jgi:hypothetical protein
MSGNIRNNNAIQRIGNDINNIEKIKKQLKNAISAEINKMSNEEVMNYVSSLNENELNKNEVVEGGAKKPKSKKSPAKKPKSKKSPAKKPKSKKSPVKKPKRKSPTKK